MKNLLNLVGCLHRCTNDARSHKLQVHSVAVHFILKTYGNKEMWI